jgi:hypothetical protein
MFHDDPLILATNNFYVNNLNPVQQAPVSCLGAVRQTLLRKLKGAQLHIH